MDLEEILDVWKEVRSALIAELEQIPAEQFGFQATPESRSVAVGIRYIVESQTLLMSELCKPDTNFKRVPIREFVEKHAAEAHSGVDKEVLIGSLKSTIESAEADLRSFGEDALRKKVEDLDVKTISKLKFLYLLITDEMHVYERLMKIEPALTTKLKEFLAAQ